MIGRLLMLAAACTVVYACARDQARDDFRREAALEKRIYVLEEHVRMLEQSGPGESMTDAPPATLPPTAVAP